MGVALKKPFPVQVPFKIPEDKFSHYGRYRPRTKGIHPLVPGVEGKKEEVL